MACLKNMNRENCEFCVSELDTSKSFRYCNDCKGYLCDTCYQIYHTTARAFRRHTFHGYVERNQEPFQPLGIPSQSSSKTLPPSCKIKQSIKTTEVELHKAKYPWKPRRLKTGTSKNEVEESGHITENLYKKTRSILNKLTPQKFSVLMSQMQALKIDTEDKLNGVVDLVYEKAISEPHFCVSYANMCRCLSMLKVQSGSKKGEMVTFRAVLLTRCQREFEKDNWSNPGFVNKRAKIAKSVDLKVQSGSEIGEMVTFRAMLPTRCQREFEKDNSSNPGFVNERAKIAKSVDEDKKDELKRELAYNKAKAQQRSHGNIRFTGELFKFKLLTENIMHGCVFKLLLARTAKSLECLCRLLTTIGKELDTEKAKPRMDLYFQRMTKIADGERTSARVRYMLQAVMVDRSKKWISRCSENTPKTITQIHNEFAQERQEEALLS